MQCSGLTGHILLASSHATSLYIFLSQRGPKTVLYEIPGKKIRSDKHGSSLPSARLVRTALETTGRVDKTTLTIAAPTMLIFIQRDISFTNETST